MHTSNSLDHRTEEDIHQNEIHPELYISRRNRIRRRRIYDFIGALIITALVFGMFTLMQVAYGIW